jgi:hypothetical protein
MKQTNFTHQVASSVEATLHFLTEALIRIHELIECPLAHFPGVKLQMPCTVLLVNSAAPAFAFMRLRCVIHEWSKTKWPTKADNAKVP